MKRICTNILPGMTTPGAALCWAKARRPEGVRCLLDHGRSANSRNRVFEPIDGGIRTVAADPAKLEDPHLIIYNAVLTAGDHRGHERRPDRYDCPVHERQPFPRLQL